LKKETHKVWQIDAWIENGGVPPHKASNESAPL
jgi:hypothetical protein